MPDDRGSSGFWSSVLSHGISLVLSLGVTVLAAQILVRTFEGPQDANSGEANEKMQTARREWAKKHGSDTPFPDLTSFEQTIMQDMIFPSQINASFDSIGGLEKTKSELFETVLLPLSHPYLYQSINSLSSPAFGGESNSTSTFSPINNLLSAPTGVLFYGPPGCGKTIMAKAIAQSADCTFIQCNFATLISKYYGESEKFIASLFSVARKFAPSVIFIDEVDMYLGKRSSNDREQESRMKAQFLSLWDGLTTNSGSVLVLGATNRPFDLDEAILRRFSKQILFDLPTPEERLHILNVLLSNHVALDEGVLEYVAMKTNGFSGSDLKELSKRAAMEAVREHLQKRHQHHQQQRSAMAASGQTQSLGQSSSMLMSSDDIGRPRATTKADFDLALAEVKPTGQQSMEYLKKFYTQSGTPTRFTTGNGSTTGNTPTTGVGTGSGSGIGLPHQSGSGNSRAMPPLSGPPGFSITISGPQGQQGTQAKGKKRTSAGTSGIPATATGNGGKKTTANLQSSQSPLDEDLQRGGDDDEYQDFQ
jgi:ATP-dependent 26S proteasome regulatory subunit